MYRGSVPTVVYTYGAWGSVGKRLHLLAPPPIEGTEKTGLQAKTDGPGGGATPLPWPTRLPRRWTSPLHKCIHSALPHVPSKCPSSVTLRPSPLEGTPQCKHPHCTTVCGEDRHTETDTPSRDRGCYQRLKVESSPEGCARRTQNKKIWDIVLRTGRAEDMDMEIEAHNLLKTWQSIQ